MVPEGVEAALGEGLGGDLRKLGQQALEFLPGHEGPGEDGPIHRGVDDPGAVERFQGVVEPISAPLQGSHRLHLAYAAAAVEDALPRLKHVHAASFFASKPVKSTIERSILYFITKFSTV